MSNKDNKNSVDEILKAKVYELYNVDYYKKFAAAKLKEAKPKQIFKKNREQFEGYTENAIDNKYNLIFKTLNKIIDEKFYLNDLFNEVKLILKYTFFEKFRDKAITYIKNYDLLFDFNKVNPEYYDYLIRMDFAYVFNIAGTFNKKEYLDQAESIAKKIICKPIIDRVNLILTEYENINRLKDFADIIEDNYKEDSNKFDSIFGSIRQFYKYIWENRKINSRNKHISWEKIYDSRNQAITRPSKKRKLNKK